MSITAFAAEPTPLQNGGTVSNSGNYSAVLVKGVPFTIKVDDFSSNLWINSERPETYPGLTMNDLTGELTIIASEAFFDKIGETGELSLQWARKSSSFGSGYATVTLTADTDSLGAQITAEITAADFAYERVIPSGTTLTEAKHENVLLGTTAAADGNGIVSIKDIKHPTDKVNVYYTVDLTNGDLTDGTNTIAATYKYKQGEGEFAAINGTTKVTVYENATVKNSLVNVTADDTQWKAAPAGTYNATVVFNFAKEEAEEKITVGSLLSTALVAIPDGWTTTSTWTGENANHNPVSVCTQSESLYLFTGAGWSKLTSFGDEVEKIESSDNYAFTRLTHEVIFVMTDGHLTAIIVSMENIGSDVEFTPKVG